MICGYPYVISVVGVLSQALYCLLESAQASMPPAIRASILLYSLLVNRRSQDTATSGEPPVSSYLRWSSEIVSVDGSTVPSALSQTLATLHLLHRMQAPQMRGNQDLIRRANLLLLGNAVHNESVRVVETALAFLLRIQAKAAPEPSESRPTGGSEEKQPDWSTFAALVFCNHASIWSSAEDHPFAFLYVATFSRYLVHHSLQDIIKVAERTVSALKVRVIAREEEVWVVCLSYLSFD